MRQVFIAGTSAYWARGTRRNVRLGLWLIVDRLGNEYHGVFGFGKPE